MSKVLRLATSASPTTTVVSGASSGQVTCRKSDQPVAPSSLAASSGSFGMDWRPTRKSSALTPVCCQVHATIIESVFQGSSCRNDVSAPGRCSAPRMSLAAPPLWRMKLQMTASPAPESAYGSMNGSRSHVPPLIPKLSTATSRPRATGTTVVPTTHMSVLRSEVVRAGSSKNRVKFSTPIHSGELSPSYSVKLSTTV
jgi:hypothetical protein